MAPSAFCVVSSIQDAGNLFGYSKEYIDETIKKLITVRKMYQFFNIYKSDIQIMSHALLFLNVFQYIFIFFASFFSWSIWYINIINFFMVQFYFNVVFLVTLNFCGVVVITLGWDIKLLTYVQYEYLKFNSKID